MWRVCVNEVSPTVDHDGCRAARVRVRGRESRRPLEEVCRGRAEGAVDSLGGRARLEAPHEAEQS